MSGSFRRSTGILTQPLPRLSNNSVDPINDINLSPGEFAINGKIARLTGSLTKQLDAPWTEGNNVGGRFSNVPLDNVTYHVFALVNEQGVVDAGMDNSAIAANRPAGWSAKRIGSLLRLNNAIRRFVQTGAWFDLKTINTPDLEDVFIPSAGALYRVSAPAGIKTLYRGHLSLGNPNPYANLALVIQPPDQDPLPPAGNPYLSTFRGTVGGYHGNSYVFVETAEVMVATNADSQVYLARSGSYFGAAGAGTTLQPRGWVDLGLLNGDY